MLNLLLFISFFNLHDHHISVCDLVYNDKNKSIEIIQTVIAGDLEKALKKELKRKGIDLLNEENFEENEVLVSQYFEENFRIFQNDKKLKQSWIGYEIIDNELRAYIEIEGVLNTENLLLKDYILTSHFRKQKNMVHYKLGETLKTEVLTRNFTDLVLNP